MGSVIARTPWKPLFIGNGVVEGAGWGTEMASVSRQWKPESSPKYASSLPPDIAENRLSCSHWWRKDHLLETSLRKGVLLFEVTTKSYV